MFHPVYDHLRVVVVVIVDDVGRAGAGRVVVRGWAGARVVEDLEVVLLAAAGLVLLVGGALLLLLGLLLLQLGVGVGVRRRGRVLLQVVHGGDRAEVVVVWKGGNGDRARFARCLRIRRFYRVVFKYLGLFKMCDILKESTPVNFAFFKRIR